MIVGNILRSPADVNLEGESGIGDSISAVVRHKLLRIFCKSYFLGWDLLLPIGCVNLR